MLSSMTERHFAPGNVASLQGTHHPMRACQSAAPDASKVDCSHAQIV